MNITIKQLAIHVTTRCTLNCKHCAELMPDFKKRGLSEHFPLDRLCREVDELFRICDYIEDLTLSGGESLMHPNIFELCTYVLKYSDQYNNCRVFSNGTIVPNPDLLGLMKQYPEKLKLVIDDYGPDLSKKVSQISKLWADNGLQLRVVKYWGEDQHCGGWVNYGDPSVDLGDSYDELYKKMARCHVAQYACPVVFNGKMAVCSFAVASSEMGYFPFGTIASPDEGYVDLFDETIPLSRKREIVSKFKDVPLIACRCCNGFDIENAVRIPAAEQE